MRVHVELAAAPLRSPVVESFAVAIVAAFARRESQGRCTPSAVWVRQPAPSSELARTHEKTLGAPVHFGSTICAVDFPADLLAAPLQGADPELVRILERAALAELERGEARPASLAEQVRACFAPG